MNKWLFLLAVPYVVSVATVGYSNGQEMIQTPNYFVDHIDCHRDKDFCEDMAEALNEAHKRRTYKPLKIIAPGGDETLDGSCFRCKDWGPCQ